MSLREEVDDIVATGTPSPAKYRLSFMSWDGSISTIKKNKATVTHDSFLVETVERYVGEVLDHSKTKHTLRIDIDSAYKSALTSCIRHCTYFLETFLKNKAPKQNKLYKYFDKVDHYKIYGHTKFEDVMFGFAKFIKENKFEGKDDPKVLALIAALQVTKEKMIRELGIEEPKPKRRY